MPIISADSIYHIDISADPSFSTFKSHHPENIECDDMIKGVGNCSWQISMSALDEDGDPIITRPIPPDYKPFVGPMRDYFRLRYGNVVILAGPLTSYNVTLGDDFISLAGKTWEHFLERWQYPFDPRVTPTDDADHTQDYQFEKSLQNNENLPGTGRPLAGSGLAYECFQRDVILIMRDILTQAMVAVPFRHVFDISKLSEGLSTIHANFELALGDKTYMNSFIDNLSGIGQGFDWWISHGGKVYWATPYRFGDPGNPTLAFTVDSSTPLDDGALSFENNGPAATHVMGTGAGFAVQTKLARAYGYEPAQLEFTRLDKSYDFGDMRNKHALVDRTQKQLSMDLQPQHNIPLRLDPYQIPNFWSIFRKGRGIWIDYDLYSNRINSLQQIVKWEAKDENNSGNLLVDLTLEQRYDLSFNAGSPEG